MTLKKQRVSVCPVMDVTIDKTYNQRIPIETPELISCKLQELDVELQRIPKEKKKEWLMAMQQHPELCDEKFRLMFLRCEVFDCTLAAKRVVKYWAKRVQLFGVSKAFKPLILGEDGPFDCDERALMYGMFQATGKTDASGRRILFCDPSRLPVDHNAYDNKSVTRATWYMAHAALEDETTQKKGTVIIIYQKNVKLDQFNPKLAKMFAESFQGCIPVRLSAIHFCHLPKIFDVIFPLIKAIISSDLRKKIHLNSGGNKMLLQLFESKFGIPKESLPVEVGGSLELNHEKWLKERIDEEKM